jgi:outer membrane biosynthesis protein TonB
MDRAEATGFGFAVAGHAVLLAALSLGFASARQPPLMNDPIEVQLIDEIGIESAAPQPSAEAPAAKLSEVEAPIEPAPPMPKPLEPEPAPRVVEQPKPKPRPVEKAKLVRDKPKPAPPRAAPVAKAKPLPKKTATKSGGRLSGILDGVSDRESQSRATAPAAKTASAAVQSSLRAEVLRQLKPHWRAPSGADVELLRTELSITLAPNGAVTSVKVLKTTGQNDSNRPQVKLHQEHAVRAARLASPFRLPAEYYDAWKLLSPIRFDKRLSQ